MKRLLAILLLIIFIIPSAQALSLSISPGSSTIPYAPETTIKITFYIGSDEDQELRVKVEGPLAEYFEVPQETINIIDRKGRLTVYFNIPKLEAGQYNHLVGVEQIVPDRSYGQKPSAVILTAAVFAPVKMLVPCNGKCIKLTFNADNGEIGDLIFFRANLENTGELIDLADGYVDIFFNSSDPIATIPLTEVYNIRTYQKATLRAELDTANYAPGTYGATAHVNYDGHNKTATTSFRLGTFELELLNIFVKNNYPDTIATLAITLRNIWNEEMSNIYGDIIIKDVNNKIVLDTTTPGIIKLNPFAIKTVNVPWNTYNLSVGNYTADVTIYYGNKSIHSSKQVELIAPPIQRFIMSWEILILLIISALIIFLLLAYKKKKKKRRGYGYHY